MLRSVFKSISVLMLFVCFPALRADAGVMLPITAFSPDIPVAMVKGTFQPVAGSVKVLQLNGFAIDPSISFMGSFSLSATFDVPSPSTDPGTFAFQGGTLTIAGMGGPTVLAGSLTNVWSHIHPSGLELQFLADVTENNGTLVGFPGIGSVIGVKINSLAADLFLTGISNLNSSADVGSPVPEPSSVIACTCVLTVVVLGLRRRKLAICDL